MKSSKKKSHIPMLVVLMGVLIVGIVALNIPANKSESVQEVMRDAVLHDNGKIRFLGLIDVNPGLVSGVVVSALLLTGALLIRVFAIPRFTFKPGKFQIIIEWLVSFFDNIGKTNSPHRPRFISIYIFGAGIYIFFGTLFELFGLQGITTTGNSIALPAPLSDINGAISLGCLSYFIILSGGFIHNGPRGVGKALKDFSLPISMSFRLFGALLSGLLVSELVYYYLHLSFVLPIIVAVLFTLLHALIQTYVLVMLTALFYGEVTEPHQQKRKKEKSAPSL